MRCHGEPGGLLFQECQETSTASISEPNDSNVERQLNLKGRQDHRCVLRPVWEYGVKEVNDMSSLS